MARPADLLFGKLTIVLVMVATLWLGGATLAQEKTPPQETEPQETPAREAASQETASEETTPKETAPAETAPEETTRKTSEYFLPSSTRAWVSISSFTELETALYETKFGKLATDPDLAPVIESFSSQITDWLDNRNVKFAMNMEKVGKLNSGEVCFAAILNQEEGQSEANNHGLVIMVDVAGHEADYIQLMSDIETDLTARKATSSELEVLEQKVTRWDFEKPQGIAVRESVFFTRVDDRLIACDDLTILSEVMAGILSPEPLENALVQNEPFVKVRTRCLQGEADWKPQIRWFFEPFGYVELTDIFAKKNRILRLDPNAREPKEIALMLQRQGFGATKAIGGDFMFAHKNMEMLHRFFIYAPGNSEGPRFEKAAQLLDFPNPHPEVRWESWVPNHAATAATFHWNFATGIDSIGLLVDEFTQAGNWETMVEGWKKGRQGIKFDIKGIAQRLGGKITFISDFEEPIEEGSERIVVALKIAEGTENEDWIAKDLDGFFKPQKSKWKALPFQEGRSIWKSEFVQPEEEEIDLDDLLSGEEVEKTPEAGEPPLFPEQYVVVANGNLFFSNNVDFLRKVANGEAGPLTESSDFKVISEKLDQLSPAPDSIRQFGRVDRSIKFMYELLRKNKVPRDNSLLARMLKEMQEGGVTRKVDGSKLPQDFENVIAPHLGVSGWSLETESDGWFFVGVILPKPDPDAANADPFATDTDPDAPNTEPDTTKTDPDATKTDPDATKPDPDAAKAEPEAPKTDPDATDTDPDAAKTDPDATNTDPATSDQ